MVKRQTKNLIIVLLGILLLFSQFNPVFAFPPLPSSFYGEVTFNNENVPDGTLVEALIEEKVYAESLTETYQGKSVYTIDIPGNDPGTKKVEGGAPGQTISFRVGGQQAEQTGVWQSGTNINLDLSAAAEEKLLPPQPTRTPIPTQTPITYEPQFTPTMTQAAPEIAVMADDDPIPEPTNHANKAQTGSQDLEGVSSNEQQAANQEPGQGSPNTLFFAGWNPFRTSPNDENNPGFIPLLWIGLPIVLLAGMIIGFIKFRGYRRHNSEDQDLI